MSGRGLRLRLTHHLSRPPPHHHALPVEDAAGALVISRAGAGCSGERRPTLGGRLAGPGPTGLAGPRLWGGGAFGSPGPGPGPPWDGRLPVEPAGLPPRHPGGAYTVAVGGPAFGLSSALFWVEAAVVPAVVLLGVPCPGGSLDVWGPGLFMPASCLAGWGCCSPHTLLNIYMEEPYEHKRAHTHRCTLKHSHWCKKQVLTDTHCLDLLLLQNLFCNISYVCCSITFNI